jgi:hypothetical protein
MLKLQQWNETDNNNQYVDNPQEEQVPFEFTFPSNLPPSVEQPLLEVSGTAQAICCEGYRSDEITYALIENVG